MVLELSCVRGWKLVTTKHTLNQIPLLILSSPNLAVRLTFKPADFMNLNFELTCCIPVIEITVAKLTLLIWKRVLGYCKLSNQADLEIK